jgi:hypothetical protein
VESKHVEKSYECPLPEESIFESEIIPSTPNSPVKIEDNSMLDPESDNCSKIEDSGPFRSSSTEQVLKDRNETDALNVAKHRGNDYNNGNESVGIEEKSLKSSETISKNPFDDKGDEVCATGNPFDGPNKTNISPVAMKIRSKSFIIRSQPPSGNAISHTISQQRNNMNTGLTSTSHGPKSLPVAAAPSYPKSLFAARSNQNEIPPSSSTASSSASSMGSSVRRPSVSVAVSMPPSRTPLGFVAPRESIKDFSPDMLT